MKRLLVVGLLLIGADTLKAQTGANCLQALPFCTGTNYTFPNSTGVPSLGNVACLGSTPNPIWYFMQVQNAGNINITMQQTGNSGGGLDVDFAVWGPFPSLAAGCGNPFPPGTPVSCSYSTAFIETAVIPNAPAGAIYIMLITNFSNQPGTITFSQTGGTGTTNCGILAGGTSNGPICEGQTLTLSANAVPNATYSWSGPNGFSSNLQNVSIPNASIANSGTYTLIVSTSTGADTASIDGIVKPKPNAAYSGSAQVCLGQPALFDASASTPVPGITTYQWIFNNSGVINQTTSVPSAQFTWPVAGTYNTGLIVTDNGCKDTANFQVVVSPNPTASFTMPTQACEGELVQLDASASSVTGGSIEEYRWDMNNDGSNDYNVGVPIFEHIFSEGSYSVKLTVVSNMNCSTSLVKPIQVFSFPQLGFEFNDACVGGITQFTNTTTYAPSNTISYGWNMGGNYSTQTNPSTVLPGLGTYDVILIGVVNNLCADTLTQEVTISNDVTAGFSFNEPCGFTGIFVDESTIPAGATGTINGWNWNFADGNSSSEQNPTHVYTANGIYNVTLIVSTAEGCYDTLTQSVPKYAIPVAAFSAPNVCDDLPTVFFDSSSVSSGSIQTWNWSFGDGATSNAAAPVHGYDAPGVYNISLVVTTENGCVDTAYSTTQVYPNPVAAFSTIPPANTTLLEPDVQFVNASTGGSEWLWTVSTVGSSESQNPLWTFEATGTYVIGLIVTNEFGCTDDAKQEFIVMPAYNFFAATAFTPFNGDALNEYWRVHTMGMKSMTLRIYNRWGEQIYSTQDPAFLWDGTYLGKKLPADVYVYKADTRDIEGKQYQYFGTVTIVE